MNWFGILYYFLTLKLVNYSGFLFDFLYFFVGGIFVLAETMKSYSENCVLRFCYWFCHC